MSMQSNLPSRRLRVKKKDKDPALQPLRARNESLNLKKIEKEFVERFGFFTFRPPSCLQSKLNHY
ncbi:hypothetical protein AS888_12595 [Peribacillus simplex]|uniref:Uncharacterized protein n=1 Tax=Peribacillus simplex TaxID=1478 RepID=A0A109N2M3_9BACI|nr:hypothetical protein AS888_12595 [Peribacillus simplex]